jgi:hypothetical protein
LPQFQAVNQLLDIVPPLLAVEFPLAPVNRHRLARFLGLPSLSQLDPITDLEIRKLDQRRSELISFWSRAIPFEIEHIEGSSIQLNSGAAIESSPAYISQLKSRGADSLIVAAFTLGSKIDQIVKRHLDDDELFEAFVLKQWAATMAEQARVSLTRALRNWAEDHGRSLLPYDGPGYNGWPLAALNPLLEMLYGSSVREISRPMRATHPGVLLPINSMLIVYGVTPRHHSIAIARDHSLAQCHRCAMTSCNFRS